MGRGIGTASFGVDRVKTTQLKRRWAERREKGKDRYREGDGTRCKENGKFREGELTEDMGM